MKIKLLLFLLVSYFVSAQENLTYQKPPKEILELADYERAPTVNMDTNKEYMLLSYRSTYKTLDELNQEEMRLGGLRINPVTNISSTVTYVNNLKLRKIAEKDEIQVKGLPENPKISNLSMSPNQKKIAFSHTTNIGVELWIIDVVSAQATKLTEAIVNANMGNPFSWFADSQSILVRMLVQNRPALIDVKKDLPTGPTVSTS
ncbi:MAG TPA: S9 family peptidase, partial [Flavobacterium sp.]|nr:S9 family peptidase [Flavobacterium sp.]